MDPNYGTDVLAPGWQRRSRPEPPQVEAVRGLVVEEAGGGFCGAVVACEKNAVTLEDRFGRQRVFPLNRGAFLLEGRPVTLIRPAPAAAGPRSRPAAARARSPGPRARPRWPRPAGSTSKAATTPSSSSRSGATTCVTSASWWSTWRGSITSRPCCRSFAPGPQRRLGVLVDHLVPGSKEQRIAAAVTSPHVLVVGHPYVDIWQAVKPAALGIPAWPVVPRGTPWKEGVLRALGWGEDTAAGWKRILAAARSYADLESELLGRVEELIDFVTAPGTG